MHRSQLVLPRSFLYVPGNKPDLFAKAAAGPADAVILDLEDAVPLGQKDEARKSVRTWLLAEGERLAARSGTTRQEQWVRVNADDFAADLQSVASPALDGIFLAKCGKASVQEAAELLAALAADGRLSPGVSIIGLIEDAAALVDLASITDCERLVSLAVGEVDLMADLRMTRSEASEPALDSIRTRIVIACAAAGLSAPVSPTSTAIRDVDAFELSARKLHDLGFRSRTAIHPSQVPVINRVFTPDAAAVAAAKAVLAGFDGVGGGVIVDAGGRMIDEAVLRSARETVSRASIF
ncbi:HpcH/HpaI aldolase/citrate lyase family protein [Arthrobacter gengyunqii]|uniref:HpcH/HpaI aldolase/citrate lyase family protein n=1 Tax=Arthrobacter gengyunqii TaxID=2886940 RepID=A0ABS8GK82_9MICC|nr:aldolase/citrate lyase family protein [Arthrobacter gengyunqii]MCC3266955.1 HpcH/HpaI aldolase/citrate lyase family protein [Arthrobacter gengyunqii]